MMKQSSDHVVQRIPDDLGGGVVITDIDQIDSEILHKYNDPILFTEEKISGCHKHQTLVSQLRMDGKTV